MGAGVNSGKQGINWARGLLRLWIIASVAWCLAIFSLRLSIEKVTWLLSQTMVHVKISNTEQIDYPAEWGVQRIREDLEKRMVAWDQKDRDWAAQLSESRKAECRPLIDLKFADYPPNLKEDCLRLFFVGGHHGWHGGWESQVEALPKLGWNVLIAAAPLALGPPFVLLVLGASILWAFAGFKRSST
jgi:hypothetical protein